MSTSEFGMFLPTESAYTKPGAYGTSQRGEAMKRGTWLSQLDQFYEELEAQKEYQDNMIQLRREEIAQKERFYAGGGYGGGGGGGAGSYGGGGGSGGGYGNFMIGPSGRAMPTTHQNVGKYGQPWTSPMTSEEMSRMWNRDLGRAKASGMNESYEFPWE